MGTVHISSATGLWVLGVGLSVSLPVIAVFWLDTLHTHCSVSGHAHE